MATFKKDPNKIDRLSSLPEALLITILSLLPTHIAAQTSVLSRHFRHLWKACPTIDLSYWNFPGFNSSTFVDMANSALLSREPSNPLNHLRLRICDPICSHITDSFMSSLFAHAHSLGVRHLSIHGYWQFASFLHSVFSIGSLESLSIRFSSQVTFPSAIALSRLKRLSINLNPSNSAQVKRLLLELCCLEDLKLWMSTGVVSLSSLTVKRLKLLGISSIQKADSFKLCMPSLEFLYLKNLGYPEYLPHICGDIPLLRKSVISIHGNRPEHVTAVARLLHCISHVEELSLDFKESWFEEHPFPILMESGKEAPAFPNLKHLDASMCFHEHNFEAVVRLLHRSPAIQSLKLIHKAADKIPSWPKKRKMNNWRSKLPRNADGNYQYAYFRNLHLKNNNKGFMKLLNKKSTPKKMKVLN